MSGRVSLKALERLILAGADPDQKDDNGKSPQDVVTWFMAGKFRESETLGIVRDLEDVFSIGTAQSIGICPIDIAVALMSQEPDGAAVSDDVNR
jgi:hypothetical protein